MIVIGLCGPAGSGKTTVANYLARTYGARLFALAEPLKHIIQRAFDLRTDQLWGPQHLKEETDPRYGVSPRWLMQHIGTNGIRSVMGDDFWVKYTMRQIEEANPRIAVIEDVRFISEAAGISFDDENMPRENTWIWKLDHPWLKSADEHQSETEWRQIEADHVIATGGKSLDELYLQVDQACARFNVRPAMNAIEAP